MLSERLGMQSPTSAKIHTLACIQIQEVWMHGYKERTYTYFPAFLPLCQLSSCPQGTQHTSAQENVIPIKLTFHLWVVQRLYDLYVYPRIYQCSQLRIKAW